MNEQPQLYIYSGGREKRWRLNGKLHNENGPAVEFPDGEKHWLINGLHHREGGPAVEFPDGSKSWWLNGDLHRTDGPAVDNAQKKQWFLKGKEYSYDEWKSICNPFHIKCFHTPNTPPPPPPKIYLLFSPRNTV